MFCSAGVGDGESGMGGGGSGMGDGGMCKREMPQRGCTATGTQR